MNTGASCESPSIVDVGQLRSQLEPFHLQLMHVYTNSWSLHQPNLLSLACQHLYILQWAGRFIAIIADVAFISISLSGAGLSSSASSFVRLMMTQLNESTTPQPIAFSSRV